METSVVSNSEEEEKYLSEFDELQSITDTKMLKIRQLTSSTMNEIYGRNWRRRKKQQDTKEREERELDIQGEMEELRWTKEKEFELEVERERISLEKLKVEMGVQLKSSYVEGNTEDTVVRNYWNTMTKT